MVDKVLLVIGAGPGLGASVARRFGRDGYAVELIARDRARLEHLADDLRADKITVDLTAVDITEAEALTAAVDRIAQRRSRIDVLHFNPSVFRHADPLHLNADQLLEDVCVGVASLLTAVQAARPVMSEGARITVTGSMAADQPWHEACSLGVQKAALRNLVISLDHTLAPHGIRAMSLTVNGTLAPDSPFSPERIAEAIHRAASTPPGQWRAEVAYDG